MNNISRYFVFLIVLMFSCHSNNSESSRIAFDKILDEYYEGGLLLHPLSATFAGDNRYNDKLPNFLSDEYVTKLKEYATDYLEKVNQFNIEELSESQKISRSIIIWDNQLTLDRLKYRTDLFPIDQMWSFNLTIPALASGSGAQPFETVLDYQNWLSRLDGYINWLQTAESKLKEGVSLGQVLPKALIVKVLPQLSLMITENVEDHLFFTPIKNMPDGFSTKEKEMLRIEYFNIIKEKLIPAYRSIHEYMSQEYLEAGRISSGIDALENGASFYNHQIKHYTTTDLSANEIHQIGLDEVARILSEMEKIKNEVGFKGGLKAFFNHVRNKKELMPFSEPQAVIDNFYDIYDKIKPSINKLFDSKPTTAFEVRRTPAFREKSAAANYNGGSLDGTRPGIFFVPIPDIKNYNFFRDEALFLHEAIPGHHFQISLTRENKELPAFRKTSGYSVFSEGWALYTESLGKELGIYTDPYQHLGMLGSEIHRAVRLVVDTGLHAKGWTREEAIQYSMDNEAMTEQILVREIERYMANPGQALSYKIGQLKISELREKAKNKLGDKFDIREYHNQVLNSGSLPMAVLEDKINSWINSYE